MLNYHHENQTDESHLDNEPLLQLHRRTEVELHSKLSGSPPLQLPPPPLNVSTLFDETDCLVDLSFSPLLPSQPAARNLMESHVVLDSDNGSDYENPKLDENANIRTTATSSAIRAAMDDEDTLINFDPNADIADNLLAIFVVSFDAKLGNLIEWQQPLDLDLKHIEFKAMASGFHLISNDLVYFCKDDMFGLAAFESIRIENVDERNIRMKSVGLVAKSFKFLKRFIVYLKNQVRYQVENPGNYERLQSLWDNKAILDVSDYLEERSLSKCDSSSQLLVLPNNSNLIEKIFSRRVKILKQLSSSNKIEYRTYTKFALHLGASMFTIWKYALLNKRILFYSSPPIKELCDKVVCTIEMINTNFEYITKKQLIKPYFYVHVTDIDELQREPFYVACTSERIFENKDFLYDLFVNDGVLRAPLGDSQRSLLKVNAADRRRFEDFLDKINELTEKHVNIFSKISSFDDDESLFIDFFLQQNNRIFSVLEELEYQEDAYSDWMVQDEKNLNLVSMNTIKSSHKRREQPNVVTGNDMRKMGLDPADDRDFINELIRFYDFNLILASNS